MKCETCGAGRSRLHKCVTCGKRLCGCCSFGSRAGRVCMGECHRQALARFDAVRVELPKPVVKGFDRMFSTLGKAFGE